LSYFWISLISDLLVFGLTRDVPAPGRACSQELSAPSRGRGAAASLRRSSGRPTPASEAPSPHPTARARCRLEPSLRACTGEVSGATMADDCRASPSRLSGAGANAPESPHDAAVVGRGGVLAAIRRAGLRLGALEGLTWENCESDS